MKIIRGICISEKLNYQPIGITINIWARSLSYILDNFSSSIHIHFFLIDHFIPEAKMHSCNHFSPWSSMHLESCIFFCQRKHTKKKSSFLFQKRMSVFYLLSIPENIRKSQIIQIRVQMCKVHIKLRISSSFPR